MPNRMPWKSLDISDKPYVSNRSQRSGERDLIKIARETDIIDFWTYNNLGKGWLYGNLSDEILHLELPGKPYPRELKDYMYMTSPIGAVPQDTGVGKDLIHAFLAFPQGDTPFEIAARNSNAIIKLVSPRGIMTYKLISGKYPENLLEEMEMKENGQKFINKHGFERYIQELIKMAKERVNVELTFDYRPSLSDRLKN